MYLEIKAQLRANSFTMSWLIYIGIFCVSIWGMRISSEWLIGGLMRLSKAVGVREFVVGFCVMAAASSLPNLFLGVTAASRGIPELSLGDIFGNNFVAMTLAVAIAIFFAPKKEIEANSKTVQTTAIFTMIAALFPVALMLDGVLSRSDGIVLIGLFIGYLFWLFTKKDMFSKVYNHGEHHRGVMKRISQALGDLFLVLFGVIIIVAASIGIVISASAIATGLGVSLVVVGLLGTGLGNALPEIYFAVASSKRNETQLIIGNLMGAVIFPATLVLGVVVLIHPIQSPNEYFAITSRIFLFLAAVLFFFFTRSKQKISLGEGLILLGLYVTFVATVVF
jgi:cation:H+ antiporter